MMTAFAVLCSGYHGHDNDHVNNNDHVNSNDRVKSSKDDDDDGDEQSYSLDDDFEDAGRAPDLPGSTPPSARKLGSPYVANGSGSGGGGGGGGEKVRFREN